MIASERGWSRAKHAYDRAQRPNWLASIKLGDAALDRADRILGRLRAAEATDAGLVRRWLNAWNVNPIRSIVSAAPTQAGSPSIGVVSPFRDQVDAIREQLVQAFPAEPIARHAMVIGTAHAFQGDEKDLVFVSTSIDGDSHPASLRFLESPNLFNVAITRARKQLVIVTSVTPDQLPPGLLRDYLIHANQDWKVSPETQPPRHRWEPMILEHLAAHDLPAWPGFQGAGQRIDVATEINGRSTAILCDHWDESNTPEWKTLENHRRLARAGWHVIRVSHRCLEANDDQWLRDRLPSARQPISDLFDQLTRSASVLPTAASRSACFRFPRAFQAGWSLVGRT